MPGCLRRDTVRGLEEFKGHRGLLLIWGSGKGLSVEEVSQLGLEGEIKFKILDLGRNKE